MTFKVTEHSETNSWVEAEETMWLTAAKDKLVADGHPEAAFLFATPGKRISKVDAARYGLVKLSKAEEEAAKPPEVPAEAAADGSEETKQAKASQNKQRGKGGDK